MKNLICLVVVLALAGSASASLTDGLVAAWKFDEGAGGVTADYSGNGHTGSLTGLDDHTGATVLPTWTVDPIPGVNFASGNTLDLADGGDAAIFKGVRTGSYQTWGANDDLTVLGWHNNTGNGSGADQMFMSQRYAATGAGDMNWQIGGCGNGGATPLWSGHTGPWEVFSPDVFYLAGWHHYAFVYDGVGEAMVAYIDGTAVGVATGNQVATNVISEVILGGTIWLAAANLEGKIDEMAIYSRQLSGAEIGEIMVDGVAPEPATICLLGLGGLALLRKKRS